MSHDHDHDHDHGEQGCGHRGHHHHHGDPEKQASAFRVAIMLNAIFVAAQFGFGLAANSTALIADAGHNLSDVLGLVLALTASILAKRAPTPRYTYGLRSTSILAALANATLLLLACGAIAWEAAQRMVAQPPVAGLTVTLVAAAGILVNGFSAWLLMRGNRSDVNVRGAYLHMAADAAVSLGVVVAGLLIMLTGWYWLDPVVSLGIVVMIVAGTWGLLRESVDLILSAVPSGIDPGKVAEFLRSRPG
ncbi:MAG: cation transporter, partial [Betaproteobacteria bacterium]|nr:cation transporter [Betaproteobacteria bacterium]